MVNVNTSKLDTTSLNDALKTHIPNLITDLITLKTTIDQDYTSANVLNLSFTGNATDFDKNIGLQNYKTQLINISNTIAALISLLNTDIKGNTAILINRIEIMKNNSIESIVNIRLN